MFARTKLWPITIAALLVTACGSDPNTPPRDQPTTLHWMTPAGGTISHDGATLEVPAGAVSEDVEISVRTVVLKDPPGLQGTALELYDFGPDGLTFLKPAILTVPVAGQPKDGESWIVVKYLDHLEKDSDERVRSLLEFDTETFERGASAEIHGFSSWGVISGTPSSRPVVPVGLAWDPCTRYMTLEWSNPSGHAIRVERLHRQGGPEVPLTSEWSWGLSGSRTTFVVSGLPTTAGELAYTYVFRMYGTAPNAREVFVGEVSVVALEVLPPGTIDRFEVDARTNTEIILSWDHTIALENHYDAFELERRPEWSDGTAVRTLDPNLVGYRDEDVLPGAAYDYELRAANYASCEGVFSGKAHLTSAAAPVAHSRISIAPITAAEGPDNTTTDFAFEVRLDAVNVGDVSVDYETVSGTAEPHRPGYDFDYESVAGRLTIPAGTSRGIITVEVRGDGDAEPDERFTLQLSNPSPNASIDVAAAEGTIENDDTQRPTIGLSALGFFEPEGSPEVGGARSLGFSILVGTADDAPTTVEVSVDYMTVDETATAGSDYTALSGTITVPIGTESGTLISVPVSIIPDMTPEPDETLTLQLSNRSAGSRWGIRSATGTIEDDD